MSLPSREVILKVTGNKIQLFHLISYVFVKNASFSSKNRIIVKPDRAVAFSNDTDVFVLLIHFLYTGDITGQV